MSCCLHKVVIQIFFYCLITASGVYALPDSLSLPTALTKKLAHFRQQDDLELWIYERMQYVEQNPTARIDFLMRSQQEAWRTYKTYYERLAWFDLLSVQGYYQLQTGNILASINAYEAALAFYESYPLPDADVIETVLKPLGNNYTRLADYNTALFIYRKTMSLAQKANNNNLIASTYSNMAICSRSQDDLVAATAYCQEGIRYASPKTPLYGLLLSTRADILTAQEKFDSAEISCQAALKKLQQHQHDASALYWYSGALQVAAKIAVQKQQYRKAADYAEKALQIFQQHFPVTRQREKAKVHVLLGDINIKTGQATQALRYYQQALVLMIPAWEHYAINAVPSANALYSENTLTDALCGKAAALIQLNQPQDALQHYISAFVATGKLRKEFFYAESKLREVSESRSRVEAATKLAYNLWKQTGETKFLDQLLLITEMSRAQVLMDERRSRMQVSGIASSTDSLFRQCRQLQQAILYYQHELLNRKDNKNISTLLQQAEYDLSLLNKKIKQQSFQAMNDANALTVESLYNFMLQIPDSVTMLEFVAGGDSSFIIELDNKGIQSIQVISASQALHEEIPAFMHRWFANGASAMLNEPRQFYSACYGIYQATFNNRAWKKDRHYVLIPDGMFNYLPFDALLTGSAYQNNYRQWPFLCKQVSLSQAYSLATWHVQQTAQYNAAAFTGFFVSKGQHAQQVALSIDEEYNTLSKKITGRYYTNATATWNTFNSITDSTGILHISTHAVSAASDSFPYLQLYDKPFYLFELRYKHFAPALVVLSACKTADGLLLEGEGLNSISREFTAAGAGGVISGLWNVNDKTAIALMQRFYEQLDQQPDIARALHNAKKEWLQSEHENALLQLPYYWAGFVYSGHLQKVALPAVQSKKKNYWLLPLLLIPGILFVYSRLRRKKNVAYA
ncbi:CHAT domain-containing protein [Niastella caeni]|uniref:CHAT domain-containing protein n=1 Tax=Niastella caeni TaxID=2569763 RepID=A0A4S8HGG8_9BACT|nr:CHAT domain-containing protein [Niastella caeni]THU33581.1 CHAT domain-containing protein [Niastella caeni]